MNNNKGQIIYDTIKDVFNYKKKLYEKLKNINIQDMSDFDKKKYLYINENAVFEIGLNNNKNSNSYLGEHYLKFPKLELDENNIIKEPTLERELELFFKKYGNNNIIKKPVNENELELFFKKFASNNNKLYPFLMIYKNSYNEEIRRLNKIINKVIKTKELQNKFNRPPSPKGPNELKNKSFGGNKSKLQTLKQKLKLQHKKEMDKLKTKQKNELLKLKNKQNNQLKNLKLNN